MRPDPVKVIVGAELGQWNRMAAARTQRLQGSVENFGQNKPERQENPRSLVRKFNDTMPAENAWMDAGR